VRYRVYWGGRGSGKSWAIAEALVRKAAAMPLRILCLREFQISIKHSSHKVLSDTIKRLGLSAWFTVTKESIVSRCGSEFIFMGCHGNIDNVRSMEGIDYVWAEEAHRISEASWRVIVPTIRKGGSEIWISFNMDDEADATYRRFVATKRKDVICHLVNYDSNPYFSDELRSEMEFDKEYDYQLYEHVWLGKPKKVSNAIVLNKKYVVRAFDLDMHLMVDGGEQLRIHNGLDFGHAADPCAATRSWVHESFNEELRRKERRLYISHEAYAHHMDLDEMEEWLEGSIPEIKRWPIGADNARPETISFLKNRGFPIHGAEKWQGSVEDGIAYLRGFTEIVIHPQCTETAREAHLWRYKVDEKVVDEHGQPLVLPILVKKHDHTWDSVRYGHDGQIQRGGIMGVWSKLAAAPAQ
jgi:phage terminase large subunit